ncbi:hypothetical protein JRQ81_005566 [Phrynocephalus forsythii]|uniref:SRCR domain-containing protein n=1 Tax=Phrynocephalus forsythii TaxID=171643 RepID=A0A9Q1AVI1_9SAUR|nr:hypothetical protein JRQ81_005566 [Phrynocephalus forsythii]
MLPFALPAQKCLVLTWTLVVKSRSTLTSSLEGAKKKEKMAMKRGPHFPVENVCWSIDFCSWMNLFWLLCAPLATFWYLGKGVDGKDAGLCNSRVTRYFLCKDGHPVSSHRTAPHVDSYLLPLLHVSNQSEGQYTCGYQYKGGNNQVKTSAISVAHNLTILSDMTRLANGSSRCAGRVEVLYNRQWGTVCNDGWDLKSAQVVCRELGCGVALSATQEAHFGRGSDPIWLDNVKCDGTEATLRECRLKNGENMTAAMEKMLVLCVQGMRTCLVEKTAALGAR